jgi:hypothetical protein
MKHYIRFTPIMRNPVLASHAIHLLPYRGLGTGIRRAYKAWQAIDFINDSDGNQFFAGRGLQPRPKRFMLFFAGRGLQPRPKRFMLFFEDLKSSSYAGAKYNR